VVNVPGNAGEVAQRRNAYVRGSVRWLSRGNSRLNERYRDMRYPGVRACNVTLRNQHGEVMLVQANVDSTSNVTLLWWASVARVDQMAALDTAALHAGSTAVSPSMMHNRPTEPVITKLAAIQVTSIANEQRMNTGRQERGDTGNDAWRRMGKRRTNGNRRIALYNASENPPGGVTRYAAKPAQPARRYDPARAPVRQERLNMTTHYGGMLTYRGSCGRSAVTPE